jgi:hypothetical protein
MSPRGTKKKVMPSLDLAVANAIPSDPRGEDGRVATPRPGKLARSICYPLA